MLYFSIHGFKKRKEKKREKFAKKEILKEGQTPQTQREENMYMYMYM